LKICGRFFIPVVNNFGLFQKIYFNIRKRILMTKKLYVGNLSYSTTQDDLQTLFTQVGPVTSVALITDRMTGQSKGFGFVEMETEKAAQEAIQQLNNQMLNQRNITVSEARPPREQSFGGGGGRGGHQDKNRGGFSRGGGDRRRY
jgi:RNA recognition motif-containing protein